MQRTLLIQKNVFTIVLVGCFGLGAPCTALDGFEDNFRKGQPPWAAAIFDRLLDAVSDGDDPGSTALIDAETMFSEIERQRLLDGVSSAKKQEFYAALKGTMGKGIVSKGEGANWNTHRLTYVAVDPENRSAVAIVRMLRADGSHSSLIRFWLADTPDGWRICDWHDAATLHRASTRTGMALAVLGGGEYADAFRALTAATQAARHGDLRDAEAHLDSIANVKFSPAIQSTLWLLLAHVEKDRGEYTNVLACLDRAADQDPTAPGIAVLRAEMQNSLGNHSETLRIASRANSYFGDDATLLALSGDALFALDRGSEATQAYERGLASQPSGHTRRMLTLRLLNAKLTRGLPVEAYLDSPEPRFAFGYLAWALVLEKDVTALNALVEAHRKAFPPDPRIEYYGGLAFMLVEDYVQAEEAFARGMSQSSDQEDVSELYRNGRVAALIGMGRWKTAYEIVGPRRKTFEQIAKRLAKEKRDEDLQTLLDMHREADSADPAIPHWQAKGVCE